MLQNIYSMVAMFFRLASITHKNDTIISLSSYMKLLSSSQKFESDYDIISMGNLYKIDTSGTSKKCPLCRGHFEGFAWQLYKELCLPYKVCPL